MTEQDQIIKIQALPISRVVLGNISIDSTQSTRNQSSKNVLYGNSPLIIQTPFLRVVKKPNPTNHHTIVEMVTDFESENPRDKERATKFFEFLENVEDHLTTIVTRNHMNLFTTKNIDLKPVIRINEEGKYYIRWYVDMTEASITDDSGNILDLIDLEPGTLVRMIVELAYVWFGTEMFGLCYKVHRILTKQYTPPPPVVKTEYMYASEDDEESSENDDHIRSLIATERPKRTQKAGHDCHSPLEGVKKSNPEAHGGKSLEPFDLADNIFEDSDDDILSG
jgi:hypothetical protein